MSAALTGNDSIQTRVRELDRETDLDLTATDNIRIVNTKLFSLAGIVRDFSLRRQATLSTSADTETITWTSTVFMDVTLVEIQDPLDESRYKMLVPSPNEVVWAMAGAEPNGFPRLYLLQHDGSNRQIALRPIPDRASLTVRISGYIEPTKLTAGGNTTPWQTEALDDALAYLIASERQHNKDDPFYANYLATQAQQIIQRIIRRELTPVERTSLGIINDAA